VGLGGWHVFWSLMATTWSIGYRRTESQTRQRPVVIRALLLTDPSSQNPGSALMIARNDRMTLIAFSMVGCVQ